ncbi:Glutathione synthetase [Stieleria neptunia]|uniref:Glutathione synthetase n=1 Tax=Stieleria neptunia TaxID=2527979 RepID=A0A518HT48_9BACT|nr:glutathione synthetase [Stieleria neptunia]QDV43994.1 Glutathione synthetase [Stieleria neptunia]
MRLGIVVNVMGSEEAGATTYRLAAEATSLGHEVWIVSTGNLSYDANDTIGAFARMVPPGKYSSQKYLTLLKGPKAINEWITVDDLDVLLLRSNPSVQRAWAQSAGIHFGRLAMRHGVIVLNDPNGLSKAMNKLYLQTFPEPVRPRTVVTRSLSRVTAFLKAEKTIILKPLQGSGGTGVFIARSDENHNMEDIFESVSRDGYVIAQQYLPAAAEGDTRLFLMNGLPLRHKGKYAAFRRVRTGDDIRSNIHAGGRLRRAVVNDTMFELAEMVRPRLVEDGMFLVGLDIVGDKLMEINVFSPGGLGSAQKFEKVNFTHAVLDALERKVDYMRYYRRNFSNVELATL